MTSTEEYSDKISRLKTAIKEADSVVIGAGAGLSASGGLSYTGERFQKNFADFIQKYHFRDMYSATFYHYDSLEDYWAYMSRHIFINRYVAPAGKPYADLLALMKNKDYFVITTNVDHQFQKAGFDKHWLFYVQGDYGLWQCSTPCHEETYDNEETVARMVKEQNNLRIPTELIPHCPKCGKPMSMNLRCDGTFVQNKGWHMAAKRYEDFIRRQKNLKTLYLELGVGNNTPIVIKYPFWKMTVSNPLAA
jgi:NAD-dependent SIR2 family protein deacetylase